MTREKSITQRVFRPRNLILETLLAGLLTFSGLTSLKFGYTIISPQTERQFTSSPLNRSGCFDFGPAVVLKECLEDFEPAKDLGGVFIFPEFNYSGQYIFPTDTRYKEASLFRPITDSGFSVNYFQGQDPEFSYYQRRVGINGKITERKFLGFDPFIALRELGSDLAAAAGGFLERMNLESERLIPFLR